MGRAEKAGRCRRGVSVRAAAGGERVRDGRGVVGCDSGDGDLPLVGMTSWPPRKYGRACRWRTPPGGGQEEVAPPARSPRGDSSGARRAPSRLPRPCRPRGVAPSRAPQQQGPQLKGVQVEGVGEVGGGGLSVTPTPDTPCSSGTRQTERASLRQVAPSCGTPRCLCRPEGQQALARSSSHG